MGLHIEFEDWIDEDKDQMIDEDNEGVKTIVIAEKRISLPVSQQKKNKKTYLKKDNIVKLVTRSKKGYRKVKFYLLESDNRRWFKGYDTYLLTDRKTLYTTELVREGKDKFRLKDPNTGIPRISKLEILADLEQGDRIHEISVVDIPKYVRSYEENGFNTVFIHDKPAPGLEVDDSYSRFPVDLLRRPLLLELDDIESKRTKCYECGRELNPNKNKGKFHYVICDGCYEELSYIPNDNDVLFNITDEWWKKTRRENKQK